MNLFINDKPVKIIPLNGPISKEKYNTQHSHKDDLISKKLIGHVLIEEASTSHIERLFKLLEIKKLKKLHSLTLAVHNTDLIIEFIKDQFKIIKASGGIVKKEDKVLLIYRMSKWDLPKGKLKKGEDPEKGAQREVEEECNVRVTIDKKLCSTWHTYIRKGRKILKKTNWYVMDCLNDADMKPQKEEDIEEVKWMDKREIRRCMKNSYKSIEHVFEKFYEGTDY